MHAFEVLSDPVRRRILELLVDGEEPAGHISAAIGEEFGISQPAVSQHLRVLREQGFATVRPEGTRRLYAVAPEGLRQVSEWLSPFERFWRGPLAALGTELARGQRARRSAAEQASSGETVGSDGPTPQGEE
ncbi:ArsR/SmtB family transcription factor [Embleya sp. NPDC008237]|uniref:ArsR/SmtB family transcription factor n=1 Tax=Embleya sp. NPDC008237 TaxID=3363978 RepID=UPI0036EE39B8